MSRRTPSRRSFRRRRGIAEKITPAKWTARARARALASERALRRGFRISENRVGAVGLRLAAEIVANVLKRITTSSLVHCPRVPGTVRRVSPRERGLSSGRSLGIRAEMKRNEGGGGLLAAIEKSRISANPGRTGKRFFLVRGRSSAEDRDLIRELEWSVHEVHVASRNSGPKDQ